MSKFDDIEKAREAVAPKPPSINLTPDVALVVFQCDLAVHMLQGMMSQLMLAKLPHAALMLKDHVEGISGWRDRYVKRATSPIQVVGADSLPPEPPGGAA